MHSACFRRAVTQGSVSEPAHVDSVAIVEPEVPLIEEDVNVGSEQQSVIQAVLTLRRDRPYV